MDICGCESPVMSHQCSNVPPPPRCIMEDGQCECLPHLVGRQCSDVQSGYFCASLDFYKYEAEDAEGLSPDSQSLPVSRRSLWGLHQVWQPRVSAEVDVWQETCRLGALGQGKSGSPPPIGLSLWSLQQWGPAVQMAKWADNHYMPVFLYPLMVTVSFNSIPQSQSSICVINK